MIRNHLASLHRLQQRVMQLACNARPLGKTLIKASTQQTRDLRHSPTIHNHNEQQSERDDRGDEPACLSQHETPEGCEYEVSDLVWNVHETDLPSLSRNFNSDRSIGNHQIG
jgi:hypothetical protein